MKESSQQHYEEFKNEFDQLKAKDDLIKIISQRENELREELKVKDELMKSLNHKNETL